MSAALDKCPYCFSNIPKHLIVAIGMKVENYLLLCLVMLFVFWSSLRFGIVSILKNPRYVHFDMREGRE